MNDETAAFVIPEPMTHDEIENEIAFYEQRYGMSSEEFLKQRSQGEAPDNFDTTDWFILLKHRKDAP
jgi:hypothetical protein